MFNIKTYFNKQLNPASSLLSGLCLLFILVSGQSHAQYISSKKSVESQHNKAKNAMQLGNYAIAYCIWEPMAISGNITAQYNIGWMYHNGYGLSIDDEMALYWWLKSAATGDAKSDYALGDLYAQGQGVEKDMSIALGWYISAALKGYEPARETLMAYITSDNKLAQNTFKLLLQSDWSVLGNAMEVSVDRANIRRGPDKSYKIVATLERGQTVIPLREQNGWTYVGVTGKGITAWIFSSLISQPAGIYPLEN